MGNRILLNVGCGARRPQRWINTDSSLNALIQRLPFLGNMIAKKIVRSSLYTTTNVKYMNLNKRWKFDTESIDVVYASHVFEHLVEDSVELFLEESYRVLKYGGALRIVIPDLYYLSKKYVKSYEEGDVEASHQFLHSLNLHRQKSKSGLLKKIVREIIYSYQNYPHLHKYMYDKYSLESKLSLNGFKEIHIASRGSSKNIHEILDLEADIEIIPSLHVECIK